MACCETNKKSSTVLVKDAVMNLLQMQGDSAGKNLMKYMSAAKQVYMDMNFAAIKNTKRARMQIDRRTSTIQLPKDFMMLSAVYIKDSCGVDVPVVINNHLEVPGDLVDISNDKHCHCDCGCSSEECGRIQNYEVIYEYIQAPLPGGSLASFQCYTRRKILEDGRFVEERQRPEAIYDGPTWVATELRVQTIELCKLEVKECGCIKDTPKNKQLITECCGACFFPTDCGCNPCEHQCPGVPTYNIDVTGSMMVFPSDFPTDKVIIRYYYDAPTDELFIPTIGVPAFQLGIMATVSQFDKTETEYRVRRFAVGYGQAKNKLKTKLLRFSMKGFYEYVLGRRVMP